MIFQFTVYVALYGLATALIALLSLYVLQRRNAPGGLYFSLLMGAACIYAAFNTLEMAAVDLWLKVLFGKLSYIGVVAVPATWFLFNLAYSQRSRRLKNGWVRLIWAVPMITLALVATNEWHHLIWTSITPSSDVPGAALIYGHGPAIWLLMLYSYGLMLAGTLILVRTSLATYRRFSKQTAMLLLGALTALSGNAFYFVNLYYLKIGLIEGFDLTPFTACLTGLLFAWSMFRYDLFDLVPVARDTVITDMADGVVVLDAGGRVIDVNPAARRLAGLESPIGRPASAALAEWPELLAACEGPDDRLCEVKRELPEGTCWYDARVSPLRDNKGARTGRILILRDITRRKLDEQLLEETRNNLQTLFHTLDDLIFVLDESGAITEINETVVRRLGYSREELLGKKAPGPVGGIPAGGLKAGLSTLVPKSGPALRVETHLAPGLWRGRPAVFGIARDVTVLVQQQEELEESVVTLELEVEDRKLAEARLERSLREREAMLKEIHHRVRDNMQIISGLLSPRKSGESRENTLRECQNRIMSLALVHEKLHESRDLSLVGFAGYAESLAAYLKSVYGQNSEAAVRVDVEDLALDIDTAVPCGLIIGELVSNSLKYAYPAGGEGEVRICLHRSGDRLRLSVGDDGPGLPESLDFRNTDSLGLQLVNVLVEQIDGRIELARGPGTTFEIEFAEARRASARMGALRAPPAEQR